MTASLPLTCRESDNESVDLITKASSRKRHVSMVQTQTQSPSEIEATSGRAKRSTNDKFSLEDHRAFVASIYDAGVKNASPVVLLENMIRPPECITSERVKSHLQKFRMNHTKNKEDFLVEYDLWLNKVICDKSGSCEHILASPERLMWMMDSDSLMGGEMAANLTASVLLDDNLSSIPSITTDCTLADANKPRTDKDSMIFFSSGTTLDFPKMTKPEQASSLGRALSHVEEMITSLTAHLKIMRTRPDVYETDESSQRSDQTPAGELARRE